MGAVVSFDAYHSVGVIPVDVHAIGADFLTGGVLKVVLWRPRRLLHLRLAECERALRAGPHRVAGPSRVLGFEDTMTYAGGIERWLGGTPVVPAALCQSRGAADPR